ncbi:MAG: DEAD/DEAH box helicase [Omnitrophica WOR_2 bacterium]|jgi:ATP-dependent RNA helicase DeaD
MPTFNELGLNDLLLQAVEALGFKEPMPVQAEVIPTLISEPVDLVGLAQTGTGKTAAFGLPVLHHIDSSLKMTQALILCPTRELCLQISRDLQNFAEFMPSVRITAVYGGASIETQIRQLHEGPQIIVATPGRLNDMIRRKKVDFSHVKWVVLDEADEMLDMGFQEEVDTILETTPKEKYTLLFSATMPSEVERILTKYMTNPVIKTVGKRNAGTANVKHMYYLVHAKDRYAALKRIADFNPDIYAIIFCRTRIETQEIADSLIRDGYSADSLHGDLSQAQRDHVMGRFRTRALQMLVATDVAARGLDVNDLTHVINYNLPDDSEVYIHRSGRTGRADKLGISVSIINLKEKFKIRQIEKMIGREFAQAKVPTGVQVCEKQLFHYIDKMENVQLDQEIESFLPVIFRKLEWMSKEEMIKRFVSLEFNRFLEYYRDARDMNVEEDKRPLRDQSGKEGNRRDDNRREGRRRDSFDDRDLTRMFVSIGRKDRVMPQQLIGLINEVTRSREIKVGRIDIMENYSFIDIDSASVKKVLKSFSEEDRNPDGVRIEVASERDGETTKRSSGRDDDHSHRPSSRGGEHSRRPSSRDGEYRRRPSSRDGENSHRSSSRDSEKGSGSGDRGKSSWRDRKEGGRDSRSSSSERSGSSRSSSSERSGSSDYKKTSDRPFESRAPKSRGEKKEPRNDQPFFESPWNRSPKSGNPRKRNK